LGLGPPVYRRGFSGIGVEQWALKPLATIDPPGGRDYMFYVGLRRRIDLNIVGRRGLFGDPSGMGVILAKRTSDTVFDS